MSHIRNSPVGKAVGESLPFILPVFILAAGKVRKARACGCVCAAPAAAAAARRSPSDHAPPQTQLTPPPSPPPHPPTQGLYEFLPLEAFAGVVAVLALVVYVRYGRAPSPKAAEDDLSSKSRRAQSIAQELEREAASEQAARDRKKVRGVRTVCGWHVAIEERPPT